MVFAHKEIGVLYDTTLNLCTFKSEMLKYERQIRELYYNNEANTLCTHIVITQVKKQKPNMITRIMNISHNNAF
jgi:hypothetical protein